MNNIYTVERNEYGIVLRGSLPIGDLVALQKAWTKQGYDTVAIGVASALKASMAICRATDLPSWEAEVNQAAKTQSGGDEEFAWLLGTDTGTSSKAIFMVLSQHTPLTLWTGKEHPAVPQDPSDFGRCYRLLQTFPSWRERLPKVAARFPEWLPLVREWDRLSRLYEEESPTGKCPKLYDLMQTLIAEGAK